MTHDQRFNYLSGLIDMLAFQAALGNNSAKAICVTNAYYREGKEAAWSKLLDAFDRFPDRRPEAIVTLLASKQCGS